MAQTLNVNRKERLERLFDLAQAYRGWTRKELAEELGRDPTKLAPDSGNPKFDLILQISEVIDWTLDEVADWLWFGEEEKTKKSSSSFENLDRKAQDAHRKGEYKKLVSIAHSALDVADMDAKESWSHYRNSRNTSEYFR